MEDVTQPNDIDEAPKSALKTRPGQPQTPPDLTLTLNAAAAHATKLGREIELRIQPQFFFAADRTIPSDAQYRAWTGVFWKLAFGKAEDVWTFQQALDRFLVEYTGGTVTPAVEGETL